MKKVLRKFLAIHIFLIVVAATVMPFESFAQSYATWYKQAQTRIDTLRKGNFGIQIIDKNGQPYAGDVSVRMKKHEFPFGIAFDFYEGAASMGNSYSSSAAIQADADPEIYRTERWNSYLAYAIPIESGKEYKLTLKFAEIYFGSGNSRLFDVTVEDQLFLNKYDVFTEAGGKNIAKDTSITILATDNALNIELLALKDNASIKGIVVEEIGGTSFLRINCGGPALTTAVGNSYVAESGYFDPDVNTVASKEQWMQSAMYKYFNYGVSGNSFKWSGIQPQHTAPNYTNFDNAVRWTQKVGWELKAHNLLWGGNDDHSMPAWVRNLPTPEAITDTCKMRVIREVSHYKGIIKEYDVINEPLTGHADHLQKTVGDSIDWNCFKWARSADPDAELFINDYNVEYIWGQATEYRDLVKKIIANGGPVTGVGMQAHYWDGFRVNVDELVKNVNIIAEAGLPIRFTEYDYAGNITQQQQADDFIKVLTVAFSHPSISGMISWGLSDDGAWRTNTGFFDANHEPKLAADTLLYYTKTKWATNFDSVINAGTPMEFNGYYGDYTIEVNFDGIIKEFTIPCLKANADSVFVLNEETAKLKGPQLTSTELESDNSVRLIFDKPIQASSLKRSNFKFFSTKGLGINAVAVDSENQNAVLLSLSGSVTKGDYISVSYFPGIMKATDGSVADAFGPEGINNPEAPNLAINLDDNKLLKVYPNPATNHLSIKYSGAPFVVSIFNSLGMQILTEKSNSESLTIDVAQFRRGLYLIRIQDTNQHTTNQKVLLK